MNCNSKYLFSIILLLCIALVYSQNSDKHFSEINYDFVVFTTNTDIQAFSIGKYEVSYDLWYKIYQWAINNTKNKYAFLFLGKEGNKGIDGNLPNHSLNGDNTGKGYIPVTNISWIDAVLWCNALSEYMGLQPLYCSGLKPIRNATSVYNITVLNKKGIRLPNENEWIYAATSGLKEKFKYVGSNDINEVAWFYQNSCDLLRTDNDYGIHLSGEKKPNKSNIYDMNGNVSEFCFGSLYSDNNKLVYGGSWLDYAMNCMSESRTSYPMNMTYVGLGLRLVYNIGE